MWQITAERTLGAPVPNFNSVSSRPPAASSVLKENQLWSWSCASRVRPQLSLLQYGSFSPSQQHSLWAHRAASQPLFPDPGLSTLSWLWTLALNSQNSLQNPESPPLVGVGISAPHRRSQWFRFHNLIELDIPKYSYHPGYTKIQLLFYINLNVYPTADGLAIYVNESRLLISF